MGWTYEFGFFCSLCQLAGLGQILGQFGPQTVQGRTFALVALKLDRPFLFLSNGRSPCQNDHGKTPLNRWVTPDVGSVRALRLQVGDAMNQGIPIYGWCDEHSAEAESYAAMVLKQDANEFRDEVTSTRRPIFKCPTTMM